MESACLVFTDFYWSQPGMYENPDLKPEHSMSNDFGIEYSHNKVRLIRSHSSVVNYAYPYLKYINLKILSIVA